MDAGKGCIEDITMERKFEYYLNINWKTGFASITEKKPPVIGTMAFVVKLDLTIDIPESRTEVISAKVTLPAAKVQEMVAELI